MFNIEMEKGLKSDAIISTAAKKTSEKYHVIGLCLHLITDETETGCTIKGLYGDVIVTWI